MMRSNRRTAISFHAVSVAIGVLILASRPAPLQAVEQDPKSDGYILSQILERAREYEKAFVGNYSRRHAATKILDGRTGKLKSTRDQVVDVWDYHGESPINQVQECKIDDVSADRDECAERRNLAPTYRLFNADPVDGADQHYRYEYRGIASRNGENSHRVRVIPLDNTTRHLKGEVFFLVDSLRFVGMNITLADYPFGLKDLTIELRFEDQNGMPVIAGGKSRIHIYVPLLINELTETVFTASDQRLLKTRQLAHLESEEAAE